MYLSLLLSLVFHHNKALVHSLSSNNCSSLRHSYSHNLLHINRVSRSNCLSISSNSNSNSSSSSSSNNNYHLHSNDIHRRLAYQPQVNLRPHRPILSLKKLPRR